MFDAGSTGTRVHVFKFKKTPNGAPKLAHETFKAIKPGLSPYADDPEKCTAGIQELLNVAKENVPCDLWKSTPLVLKATAGLRLLPGQKAKQLLDKVKDIFQSSPFLSREDCVSIMDGSDEVEEGNTLVSPCLAPDYEEQWEHAEVVYTIKGQKAGEPLYESCYSKVEKMLYRKVKKAEEAKDMDFYAFSYYYDRAVDIGIIDEKTDGNIKVEDYEAAAKKVCKSMETDQGKNPFLCLDLTYIAALLQELGFPKDKVFKPILKQRMFYSFKMTREFKIMSAKETGNIEQEELLERLIAHCGESE
ncbi:Ectonucleoside triphosphate diphosphohydrolase 6 [Acipenser ruthenus]|uniref:nucleoside diphosphate phosphatase n=1 Tax=Acipenser ruthenus TaxID=7906 RepID=A0A444U028_ACIRT|nr:Ectonucleoside triphosphate diphosphohydrolase 6 [Acipenser ruthenus]